MSNDEPAVPRLVAIDRRQLFLRTVDVEKLVEDEHCVRSIWELVGRLDLRLYYAQIAAVEGGAGREHPDPQLLISLWLYAYSRGISSARELARQCEYEPHRRPVQDEWPGLLIMRRVPRPRFLRAGLAFGFSLVDHQIHRKQVSSGQ
jgi:hypothetical protein